MSVSAMSQMTFDGADVVSTKHIQDEAQLGETVFDAVTSELTWLFVGFLAIQFLIYLGVLPKMNLFSVLSPAAKVKVIPDKRKAALKAVSAAASSGQTKDVLEVWNSERSRGAFPLDVLKEFAQALAASAPERLVSELTEHLASQAGAYQQPMAMNALVEVVSQSARPAELAESLVATAKAQPNSRTREILIEAFAAAGNEARVLAELKEEATARGLALATRGFLKSGKLDPALATFVTALDRDMAIPPRVVGDLFKVAHAKGPQMVQRVLEKLGGREVEVPTECLAALLHDCLKRDDVSLARQLEALALKQESAKHYSVFEPLLKLHAKVGGTRAVELFEEMQGAGLFASEGLCGNLLAKCGETQNLKFAEAIVEYLRGRKMLSLSIFKTLMKVYATCGRYGEACDLYERVLAEGFEPDQVMYGCLVKFAVKCNRYDLSQLLFRKCKSGDIQNYMWLIRAAGQDGNVDRALELLREVEASQQVVPDVAIYNATMDVCVTNGRVEDARKLLEEISRKGAANLITYNTIMKGYCSKGDCGRARNVFREMEAASLKPDSASFNCLLGAMVSAGNFADAWKLFDEMSRKGVAIDHYTVSIMMKVAKRARNPKDAQRALAVLDQARGVRVCEDDVLFNTVLDALISRHDMARLTKVLDEFSASSVKPSVHTYGLLIKAYSMLKKPTRCWDLWREMVETRSIIPNTITLSCMLDAIVCSRQVDRAVSLFEEFKGRVPPNTVMYATLIKGFASAGEADRAMEMYHQLCADGLQMNLVAFTSLIDAHARVGRMKEARELLKRMEEDGCEPNVITFSAIVKGYCMEGNLDEAFAVFEAMLTRGLTADTVIFNTLLDGCVRHSGFQLADALLAKMEEYSVEPSNFTMSIIVKMWGKRRQLDKALEVVRRNAKDGCRSLDSQVGCCLLSACFLNQAPDRALEAFAEMKRWAAHAKPDASTYSTLITGLARKELARQAAEVAFEACEAGALQQPLGDESLQLLFRALQRQGLAEELGEPLAAKLRAAGMHVPGLSMRDGPHGGESHYRRAPAPAEATSAEKAVLSAAAAGSLTGGLRSSNGAAPRTCKAEPQDWMAARRALGAQR
eukprot:CAMPEP_0177401620 /NCGR_PEP_ID=MMETSP0368-20130122/59745_1 /TAXON_ID=447022 ORGANISM="Scrippsiella hangoei-like, Strain SHHI-4" /NCGR_SAMPLE_ID=MMETSP0368 /ASSEMBLY_ACC=CAM_ASM_000363 /LENGTH=1093 /DNA_ID=CAMNT_0018869209 /DNA_START=40 /DNA_END=3322 /DNA_ORIENTATION=-